MIVVPSEEWLSMADNVEGFNNFTALFNELAWRYEGDKRADANQVLYLEPLTPEQTEAQRKGFIEYFRDCPKDWGYATEAEMLAEFNETHFFHQAEAGSAWCLDIDFSRERALAVAKQQIRAEAIERRAMADVENFKTDMYVVDAQYQRERESRSYWNKINRWSCSCEREASNGY